MGLVVRIIFFFYYVRMNEITEGLILSAAGSLRLCVRTHFHVLVCLFFWLFSARGSLQSSVYCLSMLIFLPTFRTEVKS